MRTWIGIHLPFLALETLRPRWSEPGRHVVLQQERVWVMTPLAQACGVRIGMRKGGVLTLCPDAGLHQRDLLREQAALQDVALAMLQYTPEVALAEEASLLLDVTASLRVFGGRRRLCQRLRASVEALGFTVQLGMAPTAQGAWLLARVMDPATAEPVVRRSTRSGRAPRRRVVQAASLTRCLDRLPCSLLPPVRPHQEWLQEVGCNTLGDLRKLPRAGLQRRSSREVLDALDRAYGEAPELFEWIVAPPSFSARLELPDRIEHAEAVLFAARRLILQMIGWLVARQLAVSRFVLFLEHERGRTAVAPSAVEIALADAVWQEEHLLRLLKERLGRVQLHSFVIAIRLEAAQVTPMEPPTETLFPEPGGTPEDQHRLLEILSARLGDDCVLTPAPRADHRPEVCNAWVPTALATAATIDKKTSRNRTRAPASAKLDFTLPVASNRLRPFWLLEKPVALLLRDHRPFYGSPLHLVSGPERIESGWWDDQLVVRDYFVAQGEDAACYWLYRERANDDWQWFLHGLFA